MSRRIYSHSRRLLSEAVRDQVRLRLPRTLSFYQRSLRPRITGQRTHLELGEWINRGAELVSRSGAVGIRFDRDGAWFEDPAGFLWRYRTGLSGTGTWAEYGDEYERNETALMEALLPPGGTLIDVGANVGLHSIKLARRVKGLRIIAFEPVGAALECLRQNIERNGISDEIEVHQIALTDHDGKIRMTTNQEITNFVVPDRSAASEDATETVPCRRLDDVLDGSVTRVDLIKCDVEGYELGVLRGASNTLERFRPPIFVEIDERYTRRYGHAAAAVFDLLHVRGYRHELIVDGTRRRAGGSLQGDLATTTNFLFVHAGPS